MTKPLGQPLTPLELAVLHSISLGRRNVETAKELHIAPSTVATYIHFVFNKLGARNRPQAVRIGFELGLLKPEPEVVAS